MKRSIKRMFATAALAASPLACTPAGGVGGGGVPSPETEVWFVGDSIGGPTAAQMPLQPYRGAVGGAGFTDNAGSLILDNTVNQLDQYQVSPDKMLVVGGVNDVSHGGEQLEMQAGFADFVGEMASRGIEVVYVDEPGWIYANELNQWNDWVVNSGLVAGTIDCTAYKGASTDGIHPNNYGQFANCVNNEFQAIQ